MVALCGCCDRLAGDLTFVRPLFPPHSFVLSQCDMSSSLAPPSPARQQPSGAARKHNKKKTRNSWKTSFNSTPSSPSQSTVDTRPSALSELTPNQVNSNTISNPSFKSTKQQDGHSVHSSALSSTDAAAKPSRPSTIVETAAVERLNKDERQSQSQSQGKPVVSAKDGTLPSTGTSTPRSAEFLQNLDIQLVKLQRDEERSQQSTLTGVSKEIKYPSGTSSISKAGGSSKVFDHELSQMLKAPTPTIAGAESSQGTWTTTRPSECYNGRSNVGDLLMIST